MVVVPTLAENQGREHRGWLLLRSPCPRTASLKSGGPSVTTTAPTLGCDSASLASASIESQPTSTTELRWVEAPVSECTPLRCSGYSPFARSPSPPDGEPKKGGRQRFISVQPNVSAEVDLHVPGERPECARA